MAGNLPQYMGSHHRQQYCSSTRTACSGYDWYPLTQPYQVWLKILQGTQPSLFHRIPVHLHYNTLVKFNGYEGVSLQHVNKSGFDMLQLKSVGITLPLLQLQVLKATMQSTFLDNYNLLFTFTAHGHTVMSTNTPFPFDRTLWCRKLHSIWITIYKTGSSTL